MTGKALALTLGGIVVVGGAGVLLIVLKGKSKRARPRARALRGQEIQELGAISRNQRDNLAFMVISHTADLFEDWEETARMGYDIEGIEHDEAAQAVANWLGKLPGKIWDTRLPQPNYRRK